MTPQDRLKKVMSVPFLQSLSTRTSEPESSISYTSSANIASFAGGLPFGPPHTGLERNVFRAPAYKRFDIGMNYRLIDNEDKHLQRAKMLRNIWLGLDCFNIFGLDNVSSYYWITDISNHQYAVPNYLTGRMINARILIEL